MTTGASALTPSSEPTETTISCAKALVGRAITSAASAARSRAGTRARRGSRAAPQVDVLPQRGLVLDHLLLERRVLLRAAVPLRPRVRRAPPSSRRRPRTGRATRSTATWNGRRTVADGALDAVQRPVLRLAERDGDQREREHAPARPPRSAAEGRCWCGGKRTRDGTPDGEAQHRRSCGAVARHERSSLASLPAPAHAGVRGKRPVAAVAVPRGTGAGGAVDRLELLEAATRSRPRRT